MVDKKKCTGHCQQVLSLKKFHKDKSGPDGYEHRCKDCRRRCAARRYWIREYGRKYYEDHKEELIETYEKRHNDREGLSPADKIKKKRERNIGYYWIRKYGEKYYEDHKEELLTGYRKRYDDLETTKQGKKIEKKCIGPCGLVRLLTEFCKNKKSPDGHAYKCKVCYRGYCSERNKNYPEIRKKWRKDNLGKVRASVRRGSRKRRALKRGLHEHLTIEEYVFVRSYWNNRCAVCGKTNAEEKKELNKCLAMDHWLPLSKGYPYAMDNAVLLCQSCNSKKRTRFAIQVFGSAITKRIEKKLRAQTRVWNQLNTTEGVAL